MIHDLPSCNQLFMMTEISAPPIVYISADKVNMYHTVYTEELISGCSSSISSFAVRFPSYTAIRSLNRCLNLISKVVEWDTQIWINVIRDHLHFLCTAQRVHKEIYCNIIPSFPSVSNRNVCKAGGVSADWTETIRTTLWAGLLRRRRGDERGSTKQDRRD